jgi:chromosome segregation ATPase
MEKEDLEYFDKRFDALHGKIEGTQEEVQIVKEHLGERLRSHKDELSRKIEGVRQELQDKSKESQSQLAAINTRMEVHKKEHELPCEDVQAHEEARHNIGKIITLLVGLTTIATFASIALGKVIELLRK